MNAPTAPSHLMAQVTGKLLHAGLRYDDTLTFDLYGAIDDGQHTVESVMIAGTQHNITTLIRRDQLQNMGAWLDVKDSAEPVLREWAEIHKHRAAKPNF